jgi:hypothetical protein
MLSSTEYSKPKSTSMENDVENMRLDTKTVCIGTIATQVCQQARI